MFWNYSKTGRYTVKSGYALAKEMTTRTEESVRMNEQTSSHNRKESLWKKLWGMNVKHKLKHFIWKCLHNCLPTSDMIYRRTGKGSNFCRRCGEGVETLEHILFECDYAKMIWKLSPINWDGLVDLQSCFWRWWEGLLEATQRVNGQDHIELTINILWQIWKARNNEIFNNSKSEEIRVVRKAQQEWSEFKEVVEKDSRDCIAETTSNQRGVGWEPLAEGTYRINTDAAISSKMVRTGKGIVARNWKGEIMRAWAVMEEKLAERSLEEALAIRLALKMGKEAGWRKIEIQSDCKNVVECITTGCSDDRICAVVLEDIQELRRLFEQCNFFFVHRSRNELCHRLAKFALKLVNDVHWDTNVPCWIKDLARKDYEGNMPLL